MQAKQVDFPSCQPGRLELSAGALHQQQPAGGVAGGCGQPAQVGLQYWLSRMYFFKLHDVYLVVCGNYLLTATRSGAFRRASVCCPSCRCQPSCCSPFELVCHLNPACACMMCVQEVNLANNQLAELPALWLSIWGAPDPATGLLLQPPPEQEQPSDKPTVAVKVLVLGNPLTSG